MESEDGLSVLFGSRQYIVLDASGAQIAPGKDISSEADISEEATTVNATPFRIPTEYEVVDESWPDFSDHIAPSVIGGHPWGVWTVVIKTKSDSGFGTVWTALVTAWAGSGTISERSCSSVQVADGIFNIGANDGLLLCRTDPERRTPAVDLQAKQKEAEAKPSEQADPALVAANVLSDDMSKLQTQNRWLWGAAVLGLVTTVACVVMMFTGRRRR